MKIVELAVLSGARFETYVPFVATEERDHFSGYVMSADQLKQFAELVIVAHTSKLLEPKMANAALRGDSGLIAGVPLESTVMQEDCK